MATTEKLQNEILLKEEAFLKEAKAKLTEQLNKLKVGFWENVTLGTQINFVNLSSSRYYFFLFELILGGRNGIDENVER